MYSDLMQFYFFILSYHNMQVLVDTPLLGRSLTRVASLIINLYNIYQSISLCTMKVAFL